MTVPLRAVPDAPADDSRDEPLVRAVLADAVQAPALPSLALAQPPANEMTFSEKVAMLVAAHVLLAGLILMFGRVPNTFVAAIVLGVGVGQSALLAFWAGLGASRWYVRQFFMLLAIGFIDGKVGEIGFPIFILSLTALLLVARVLGLRLAATGPTKTAPRQFSLKALFSQFILTAVLLSAVRCVLPLIHYDVSGRFDPFSFSPLLLGPAAIALLPLWPILGPRNRYVLGTYWSLSLGGAIGACLAKFGGWTPAPGVLFAAAEALTVIISLYFLRYWDARLVWRPWWRRVAQTGQEPPSGPAQA